MTHTVKVVKLDDLRIEGKRRVPYKSIVTMANHLNESGYVLPGPKGYLSPSTISKWNKCPSAVYYEQITNEALRLSSLALIFGSAQHEAMSVGWEEYRARGHMTLQSLLDAADFYLADELGKIPPEELWKDPKAFNMTDPTCIAGISQKLETGFIDLDQIMAIVSRMEPEQFNPKARFREIVVAKKTIAEFIDNINKRRDEMQRLFTAYCIGEEYRKVCLPEEVIAVEEDMFVVIDGIPIYFVADLVTKRGVYDHKFTSASQIEKRRGKVPSDIQLWIYELAYGLKGYFLLYAPPAKTSKAKERDLVTVLGRYDEGQRVLNDEDMLDSIAWIPRQISEGWFEKRGECFMGGCGECPAFEVCTAPSTDLKPLTVDTVVSLHKTGQKKLDLQGILDKLLKEAAEQTGFTDDFEED